jgi:hypothetical protein
VASTSATMSRAEILPSHADIVKTPSARRGGERTTKNLAVLSQWLAVVLVPIIPFSFLSVSSFLVNSAGRMTYVSYLCYTLRIVPALIDFVSLVNEGRLYLLHQTC